MAKRKGLTDVANSLMGKLITGQGVPAQGVIPFAALPEAARAAIPVDSPPIGWDPSTLEADELALLRRLTGQAQAPQSEPMPTEDATKMRVLYGPQGHPDLDPRMQNAAVQQGLDATKQRIMREAASEARERVLYGPGGHPDLKPDAKALRAQRNQLKMQMRTPEGRRKNARARRKIEQLLADLKNTDLGI